MRNMRLAKQRAMLLSFGIAAATASASIITVNVTDGGSGAGDASASNIAGVVPGAYIETVSHGATARNDTDTSNLRDTTGSFSGVSMAVSAGTFNAGGYAGGGTSGFNAGIANQSDRMMQNYSDTSDGTLTFSGLTAWLTATGASSYDVYVYSDRPYSQITRGAFTVDSQTYWLATDGADNAHTGPFKLSTATTAAAATADTAANYVKVSGLTGNSFDLNVARNAAEGGTGWIDLSGIQIVAIPEPATLGMVAAFGGGLLFIRRKLAM